MSSKPLARLHDLVPYLGAPTSIVLGLIVWQIASISMQPFLPMPMDVVDSVASALTNPEFFSHLVATARRIAIAWGVSILIGPVLAILMGRVRSVEALALPWVMVGLALPSPVVILFTTLFFGVEEAAAVVALSIVITPYVVNIVYQGVCSVSPHLLEMARVYRLSRRDRLSEIILPHLTPSLLAAARFSFATSWKFVVIMEAIARPDGIGQQIQFFFRLLRPQDVLAWTFLFALVMVSMELLVFRTVDRRAFQWRRQARF